MRLRALAFLAAVCLVLPLIVHAAIAEARGPAWQGYNVTAPYVQVKQWGCMGHCWDCKARGSWYWPHAGAWASAPQVAVRGVVVKTMPPRVLVLGVNGSETYVVLPWMMMIDNGGSLASSSSLLQSLRKGTVITVKGLARTHPLLQITMIMAYEITIGDATYTWPPLMWAQSWPGS